jgi:DNA polymerase-3 subunit alpha
VDHSQRAVYYFRYLVERGGLQRYGTPDWKTPERAARIDEELEVIETAGFSAAFVMLAGIMDHCRNKGIPYGPGRGSVGGCYTAYLAGIHEVDSIEYGLYFERFLNADRVSFPDVDLDFSQRERDKVLRFIRDSYERDGQVVLQIGAFTRAGARAVIDLMLAARGQEDPNAGATATLLKRCLPEGNITGGQKIERELAWWLDNGGGHGGNQAEFRRIAEQAGWLDHMLKLDGMYTHLGKHAAGVVIMREEDLPLLPQTSAAVPGGGRTMMTAYDMYAIDDLDYLKWDLLGLRTLEVICDAHRFAGGSGHMRDILDLWRAHKDDPDVYEIFQAADTLGVFQMETPGYQRTLRDFQPDCFDHIVQLVALYRPGALDYRNEEGKNMVEVFIERRHGASYSLEGTPEMQEMLRQTHGILVYQEQQMRVARELAGFTLKQADSLRKAIGKKRKSEMDKLVPLWQEGVKANGVPEAVAARWWENIEAAARYSWNKAHSVEYGIITWLSAYFKKRHPEAFYAAETNSWEGKKDRQVSVVSEARQHVGFRPPDVNVAEERFTVVEGEIVFGLNGIKGMGDANRQEILRERVLGGGDFKSYHDFCARLPSVPTNMKKALVACGAFDSLGEDRVRLLATIPKGNRRWDTTFSCGHESKKQTELAVGSKVKCSTCKDDVWVASVQEIERKRWHVLEHINDSAKAEAEGKAPKPLPTDLTEYRFPSDVELAQGEMDAMGYYITSTPLKRVTETLGRITPGNHAGGEVADVRRHDDKNGNQMATIRIITPALTHQRVRVFASRWAVWGERVEVGKQLIFRGREDGGTFLAEHCFAPGDYRHFKSVKVGRGTEPMKAEPFDGRERTLIELERAGYRVRCV